jgi:hypothetical protein
VSGYRVTVQLGTATWTVNSDDTSAEAQLAAGAPLVLDGLRFGWRYAGEDWPSQVEPMTCQLELLATDAADLAAFDVGDLAMVEVWRRDSAGVPVTGAGLRGKVASLYGTVAELAATQTRRADGTLWTRCQVQLVDHQPTIESFQLEYTNSFTAETPAGRVSAWRSALVELGVNVTGPPAVWIEDPPDPQLDGASRYLLEAPKGLTWPGTGMVTAGRTLLASTVDADGTFAVLLPGVDPAGTTARDVARVCMARLATDWTIDLAPLTLAVVAGVLELAPAPANGNGVPASRVQLGGSWRRDPAKQVTKVTVHRPTDDSTVTVKTSNRGRRRTVEADLTNDRMARDLAGAYLAAVAQEVHPAWTLDSFTWAPEDVGELLDYWIPDHAAVPAWPDLTPSAAPLCMRVPVAVFGLQPAANLAGGSTYAGMPTAVDLELVGGQARVTFTLARRMPTRPTKRSTGDAAASAASYAWLRTAFPTVTYRTGTPHTDPTMTLADLRLVRR